MYVSPHSQLTLESICQCVKKKQQIDRVELWAKIFLATGESSACVADAGTSSYLMQPDANKISSKKQLRDHDASCKRRRRPKLADIEGVSTQLTAPKEVYRAIRYII